MFYLKLSPRAYFEIRGEFDVGRSAFLQSRNEYLCGLPVAIDHTIPGGAWKLIERTESGDEVELTVEEYKQRLKERQGGFERAMVLINNYMSGVSS